MSAHDQVVQRPWREALKDYQPREARTETFAKLREPFAPEAVKQRQGPGGKKLDYVAIETVLGRLLDVVGTEYSWIAEVVKADRREFPDPDNPEVMKGVWDVLVKGTMYALGKHGTGFGAMSHFDPDMAVKTANSEAMKNAAKNGFGIGLELWDAEYREGLAHGRALAAGDVNALKLEVFRKYRAALGGDSSSQHGATADDVADHFNVRVADLNDAATLRSILDR